MLSVNTNVGAMMALQYLNQTQRDLEMTQGHINSGLKVANAKDNGAVFAIAQNMRGKISGFQAVSDSINRGVSTIDVAIAGGQSISDLLNDLKGKALAGADASLDTASRNALNADFTALRDQITTIVQNASFNGTNLVDGSTANFQALASADGTKKITVAGATLSLNGAIVTVKTTSTISTAAKASTMIGTINLSIQNVNGALAKMASGVKKFTIQATFVSKLVDTLNAGIGNLVDADMAAKKGQPPALPGEAETGIHALSIANAAPSITLSLFR